MARPVHIGCSGWNYRDWRDAIYPEGLPARRWLERYAELFDTVEVNNTFYRLPSQSAVEGWVDQTPPGFVIAVKASRYMTHVKRLHEMKRVAARYFEAIKPSRIRRSLGPCCGSCRRPSSATTSASARPSSSFPRRVTASSSATPAGSSPRSTRSCDATAPRS